MGEAADMVLDGLLCQGCFLIIDGDEPGFPRFCPRCAAIPTSRNRRHGPQVGAAAHPRPPDPELEDLDAAELEVCDG